MRYIGFIILFIFLNQCATSTTEISTSSTTEISSTSTPEISTTSTSEIGGCKIKNNSSLEETDPIWFTEEENEEFYYIVKNKEYSGDAELAKVKNRYISEILLANKIAADFMSCSDQNKALSYIRKSKDINEIQKFKSGKLIINLIGQFDIEKNIIVEGNNKFISYIKIIKVKK